MVFAMIELMAWSARPYAPETKSELPSEGIPVARALDPYYLAPSLAWFKVHGPLRKFYRKAFPFVLGAGVLGGLAALPRGHSHSPVATHPRVVGRPGAERHFSIGSGCAKNCNAMAALIGFPEPEVERREHKDHADVRGQLLRPGVGRT